MLKHDPLRFHDLDEVFRILLIHPVGAVHDETPCAARTRVKLAKRVRKALGAPPMREVVWVAKRLKYEFGVDERSTDSSGYPLP
jgi:hypothetical protein